MYVPFSRRDTCLGTISENRVKPYMEWYDLCFQSLSQSTIVKFKLGFRRLLSLLIRNSNHTDIPENLIDNCLYNLFFERNGMRSEKALSIVLRQSPTSCRSCVEGFRKIIPILKDYSKKIKYDKEFSLFLKELLIKLPIK